MIERDDLNHELRLNHAVIAVCQSSQVSLRFTLASGVTTLVVAAVVRAVMAVVNN